MHRPGTPSSCVASWSCPLLPRDVDISFNCAEVTVYRDDPGRRWRLADLIVFDIEREPAVVTFIDLTNCEESDLIPHPPSPSPPPN
jgi:hypothetical protein